MMVCDKCGKYTYVIFITTEHKKICYECRVKEREKKKGNL